MKHRLYLIILLAAVTFSGMAQTIGEAFYIYRNDGGFNAFFRGEVDSITYSHYDLDSLYYDEQVTQLIYTADSLYRIPLAAIDSIGFLQPETIYAKDAVPLTGSLFDYLVSADNQSLIFASNIPSALLPKIGDKLVATDLSDKLPIGFTGLVRQVQQEGEGYVVYCDSLALEETVTQFYGVVEIVGQEADGKARRYLSRRAKSEKTTPYHLVIPTWNQKIDLTPLVKPKDVFNISGKAVATTEFNPVITGRITRVVDNFLNISHYNIHTVTELSTVTTVELVGAAYNSDNPLNLSSPKTNFVIEGTKLGPYGIPIYYAFGPKFEFGGEFAYGTTVYANFRHTEDITFYPLVAAIGAVAPVTQPIVNRINTVDAHTEMTHFDVDWQYIAGRASARAAVVGRLGIGIAANDKSLGWVGAELQFGAKVEAELGFDFEALSNAEKGTGFYDGLKDKAKVVVMPYWGLEGKVSLLDDIIQFTFVGRDDYTLWGQKWEWDFLPIFSDTKIEPNGSSAEVTANITNDCIIPYTVGFSLFNEYGNRIGEPQWNEQKFWTRKGFNLPLKTTFTDLPMDVKYKAYPTLRLFGFNVLASPSADVDMRVPVTLSDFKVTKSQYQKGAFSHEGRAYDYRFDVSVTATLDADATGIADWGYAYLDPNGRETLISLKQFGNSYTDTRYAYFRNENPSTCSLYGYVKYVGSDTPVYGEPYNFLLKYTNVSSSFPLEIDIEQVNSFYPINKEDTHERPYYFLHDKYRYDLSITVKLKDTTSISGAGFESEFLKHSPDSIHIYDGGFGDASPFSSLSGSHIFWYDSFFPKDTVVIRPYIIRNNETIWGDSIHFEVRHKDGTYCPDDNHPHMIDMGLPSGTKWACCNVGAISPKEFGNYFAWGETQPKNFYLWGTYQKAYVEYDYGDTYSIGDFTIDENDISGTENDAASVNWGKLWKMPNNEQLQELLDSCVVCLNNGGAWFYGPNGGMIFFPKTYCRADGVDVDVDEDGYAQVVGYHITYLYTKYWSSNKFTNTYPQSDNAYCLSFVQNYYDIILSSSRKCNGCPIRPVSIGVNSEDFFEDYRGRRFSLITSPLIQRPAFISEIIGDGSF